VEIGRCVQKFAGIPCTWNYEMQTIFHHNSSGSRAFTGNLKNKEVHSAITLHPIKKAPLMYRMYTYMLVGTGKDIMVNDKNQNVIFSFLFVSQGLETQELRQESLYLHRDITQMVELLEIAKSGKELTPNVPIFPISEYNKNYLGDPTTSGKHLNLK
jgi:chondroitin sulfate synthase